MQVVLNHLLVNLLSTGHQGIHMQNILPHLIFTTIFKIDIIFPISQKG